MARFGRAQVHAPIVLRNKTNVAAMVSVAIPSFHVVLASNSQPRKRPAGRDAKIAFVRNPMVPPVIPAAKAMPFTVITQHADRTAMRRKAAWVYLITPLTTDEGFFKPVAPVVVSQAEHAVRNRLRRRGGATIERNPLVPPALANNPAVPVHVISLATARQRIATRRPIVRTQRTALPEVVHPIIVLTPTSLNFSATTGGADPASQQVAISNGGTGSLSPTLGTITENQGSGWLGGSVLGSTLTVSITLGALTQGVYTGTVNVNSTGADNTPQSEFVTLTVSDPTAPGDMRRQDHSVLSRLSRF